MAIYDLSENLQKAQNNIEFLLNKSFDFFSSHQLMPFVTSLFARKKAAEYGSGMSNKLYKSIQMNANSPDAARQSVKQAMRNNFHEFCQQKLAILKWECNVSKQKMMNFIVGDNIRGQKRQLEKRKYELLGQIQTLRTAYTTFLQNESNIEFIHGESLYYNIFKKINCLYESNIDQSFLIDMIKLKSQKRETKRFLSFLQGALAMINEIVKNDLLTINANEFAGV